MKLAPVDNEWQMVYNCLCAKKNADNMLRVALVVKMKGASVRGNPE